MGKTERDKGRRRDTRKSGRMRIKEGRAGDQGIRHRRRK